MTQPEASGRSGFAARGPTHHRSADLANVGLGDTRPGRDPASDFAASRARNSSTATTRSRQVADRRREVHRLEQRLLRPPRSRRIVASSSASNSVRRHLIRRHCRRAALRGRPLVRPIPERHFHHSAGSAPRASTRRGRSAALSSTAGGAAGTSTRFLSKRTPAIGSPSVREAIRLPRVGNGTTALVSSAGFFLTLPLSGFASGDHLPHGFPRRVASGDGTSAPTAKSSDGSIARRSSDRLIRQTTWPDPTVRATATRSAAVCGRGLGGRRNRSAQVDRPVRETGVS